MANNAININKIMFAPEPSQYLGFQHYMSWSLLWSVVLRSPLLFFFCFFLLLLILMELLNIMA